MSQALTASSRRALPRVPRAKVTSSRERRSWAVIWLCGAMMLLEIVGGLVFGSIALVADGMHMSTHAGALLLAALAYGYSRRHADDARFTFGTGKLGDLAGFTSAIILAMIALLIGYESVARLFSPVPIHFAEAIPIACLGLAVNVGSVLAAGRRAHHHGHGHGHGARPRPRRARSAHDEEHRIEAAGGVVGPQRLRGRRASACSGCAARRPHRSRWQPSRSRQCGRMAHARSSRWPTGAATWNPPRISPSRMRSPPR